MYFCLVGRDHTEFASHIEVDFFRIVEADNLLGTVVITKNLKTGMIRGLMCMVPDGCTQHTSHVDFLLTSFASAWLFFLHDW